MVIQSIKLWSPLVVVSRICFRHLRIGGVTNRRPPQPRFFGDTAKTGANLTLFPISMLTQPHPSTPQRSFTSAIGLVSLPIQKQFVELKIFQFHAAHVARICNLAARTLKKNVNLSRIENGCRLSSPSDLGMKSYLQTLYFWVVFIVLAVVVAGNVHC